MTKPEAYLKLMKLEPSALSPEGHYDYREVFYAFPTFCNWRNQQKHQKDLIDERGDLLIRKEQIIQFLEIIDPYQAVVDKDGIYISCNFIQFINPEEGKDYLVERDYDDKVVMPFLNAEWKIYKKFDKVMGHVRVLLEYTYTGYSEGVMPAYMKKLIQNRARHDS